MLEREFTNKALEKFSKYVVSQSRANLTRKNMKNSSKLYNSIKGYVEASRNSFSLAFEMEDYGKFQDKGVRGADIKHIKEEYFDIRGVWGQKIDVSTTTQTHINYHKECSVSKASKIEGSDLYKVSIGATHHKFNCDKNICNYCIETANINDCSKCYNNSIVNSDSVKLIALANDIIKLENVEVIDVKIGARASSNDYFPMIGKLVDSKKSIEKFPHLLNGTHIKNSMLETVNNLYVINGVGGRGFVLSPYLANELVEHIINDKQIEDNLSNHRLFKRWAKKQKNKDIGKK